VRALLPALESALKRDTATRDARVFYLGTTNEDADRVVALELGADDRVAKPCSIHEIVLRLEAVLRRATPPVATLAKAGPLSIDRAAHRVFVGGREVHVTALEMRLLCALYDGGSRVQTRECLLREVWGARRGITARTVDTHVKRLRRKLGEAGQIIRSVRGVGYGFDVPAENA